MMMDTLPALRGIFIPEEAALYVMQAGQDSGAPLCRKFGRRGQIAAGGNLNLSFAHAKSVGGR